jgi:hypothetical protein
MEGTFVRAPYEQALAAVSARAAASSYAAAVSSFSDSACVAASGFGAPPAACSVGIGSLVTLISGLVV